jgi:pteridine reductase
MIQSRPPDRVALITGAGKQRVGWHVADALADRGYHLAIHYRTSEAEAKQTVARFREMGVQAEAFRADLSQETEVAALVRQVLGHFGQIDVLVNCAAIWNRKPLEEVTAEDVRLNFETNALSTFLCCQQVGLAMTQQDQGGCIVNLGDWADARPYLNYAAYFPSKGAVHSITRTMAVELGTRNPRVRVNCIQPGPVMLPPDLPKAERDEAINATLVKREGSPKHIAAAVIHFIENDFITGVCLPVDGGRTIYAPTAENSAEDSPDDATGESS